MAVNIAALQPGSIIAYTLLPHELPTNPHKIWLGKVLKVAWQAQCCYVESLESGFTGLHEYVYFVQISGVMTEERETAI